MKVYTLWNVNRAYDSESLVGIFPANDLAVQYIEAHKTEKVVTRWVSGPIYSERIISYCVREYEVNEEPMIRKPN